MDRTENDELDRDFGTGESCVHGRTTNPRAAGHVPGGSSSGSAVAVAAGLLDAALGTDTGGSVRIPASFCGVVGFKPTHRSVSRAGVVDLAASLDTVGPLANSVADASRVLETLAGRDLSDPSTHPSPRTIDSTHCLGDSLDGANAGIPGKNRPHPAITIFDGSIPSTGCTGERSYL